MNGHLLLGAALLLISCDADRPAPADSPGSYDHSPSDSDSPVIAAAETMSLLGTTWEFDDDGKPTVITIDKAGAYIENRTDGTHVVHGSYVQRDGKDCFTSAMGDKSTSCWTAVPPTTIGEMASATSENGGSAVFKRIPFRILRIPR